MDTSPLPGATAGPVSLRRATAADLPAIRALIDAAYARAKRILTEDIDGLHAIARGLLEHESLSGDEIRQVLRGEAVIKKVVDEPMPESRRASVPSAGRPLPPTSGLGPAPQPG